ncbi:TonB-dependent receptor [Lysobacter fragariae]
MVQLKRNLLSVALASATLMLATNAFAQSADQADTTKTEAEKKDKNAKTLDTVVVTGIRAAIESAIETKQTSTSIVESVSSEDIGKLPDTSIADSIARLPGLTAQRFGSRPQEINIRGFAGDFSTALLNGREQVSLGNNRGVEFDQYPSELTNKVIVYKTPDAALIGQGLSGTVDLRTVRPLDFDHQVIAVNLRGDMNKLDENVRGDRYSISYIDQFADHTVGLALGYAHLNNPGQGHTFESWGYDGGLLNGANIWDSEFDNQRDGFMGVLEFKPNDMYSSTLDLFYSKFDKEETKRGFQFSLQGWTGAALNGRTDNANGTATSAQFSNVNFGVIRNDFNAAHDDLFAIGWNNKLRINDHWTVTADVSASSAKRDERILETYARLQTADNNVSIQFNPNGYFDFDFGVDMTDPANFRLMDPGGWGGDRAQAGYLKDFTVKDDLTSLRVDLERTFDTGIFSSLKFGANLTERTKSRASDENTLCLTVGCTDNTGIPVPPQYLTDSNLNFAGVSFLGMDPLELLHNVYFTKPKDHPDISNKNWSVDERVSTFYLQGNINTDLGPIPVKGNVGVQVVHADQSSTGVATFAGTALSEPATRGAAYTDYLPSLNLSFQLPADQYVRFGASRQMARPRMDQMRGNANYGYDQTQQTWNGSGGNPALKPWLADAYDLSYEKYFGGTKGYVSAAYFYKNLKTYIYDDINTNFDFSQLPIPAGQIPANVTSYTGTFSEPKNGNGGNIKGFELAGSIPFDMLWSPLEGFGLQATYSATKSAIQPLGPTFPTEPLPGLSKYVSNVTLYFERWGFSARASQRHRSQFVGEVQGFGGDRTKIHFGGESVTDLQFGYSFNDGPLKDLSLLLQVNNLENEPYKTNFGSDDRPNNFSEFGRTYLFGVNYKF